MIDVRILADPTDWWSVSAAWVQAVGSAVAIWAAVKLQDRARKQERLDRAKRQLELMLDVTQRSKSATGKLRTAAANGTWVANSYSAKLAVFSTASAAREVAAIPSVDLPGAGQRKDLFGLVLSLQQAALIVEQAAQGNVLIQQIDEIDDSLNAIATILAQQVQKLP